MIKVTVLGYTKVNMTGSSYALYKCAKENDTSLFAELLYRRGKDVDLNYRDKAGRTILKLACQNGNIEIAELLVAARCDINMTDNVGESPLYAACCSNSLEIIQLLINEGVDLNSTNQEGATALYISALNGNLEALFMLLEAGADVSIADNNGATPLHMVSEHTTNIDAARLLIGAGADVNAVNKYGWTPLHDAAQECNVLAIGYFIECGADVNIADKDGWTPLYIAAQNGHVSVVKALIKLGGAKVDIVDNEGSTALIVASRYGQTAVAEILLLAGADYFVRNNKGKRARDVAAVPHLRKLFKHFDMCIAAARLYTRHHQPSAAAITSATLAAATAAAAEARTHVHVDAHTSSAGASNAAEAEHHTHYVPYTHTVPNKDSPTDSSTAMSAPADINTEDTEGSHKVDLKAAQVKTDAAFTTTENLSSLQHPRYSAATSTPFSPGSAFPAALPDSPFRARKYVRRGVLSREGPDEEEEMHRKSGAAATGGAGYGYDDQDNEYDDPYHTTLASILDIVHEERGDSSDQLAQLAEEDFTSHERLLLAVEESALRVDEVVGAQEKVNESLWAAVHALQSQYAVLAEENKQLKAAQNKAFDTVHETLETIKTEDVVTPHSFTAEIQLVVASIILLLLVFYIVSSLSPRDH